jgi:outer membrane protein assembly factor BamB
MALAYGALYVVSQGAYSGSVQAIAAATGRTLWTRTFPGLGGTRPLVADHLLLVMAGRNVVLLDAGSGRTVRQIALPVAAGMRLPLMIAGGTLYVLNGTALIALRP